MKNLGKAQVPSSYNYKETDLNTQGEQTSCPKGQQSLTWGKLAEGMNKIWNSKRPSQVFLP